MERIYTSNRSRGRLQQDETRLLFNVNNDEGRGHGNGAWCPGRGGRGQFQRRGNRFGRIGQYDNTQQTNAIEELDENGIFEQNSENNHSNGQSNTYFSM